MATICLKFKFRHHPEITEILEKVRHMEQKAVHWLIANRKTSLSAVHAALYYPFRQQFQKLHSHWVTSALKTATGIVHQFEKRKRKGKAKRPKLKKPFVSLSPFLFKVSWDGKGLRVTISKSSRDLEPIVLKFLPHHKYKELLNRWQRKECQMGQITLTKNSVSIPLKFPSLPTHHPFTVIGIDSNERSTDCFEPKSGELKRIEISEVSRINRECDRRIRKGTKGKKNPKAKRKMARKYGFIRREKTKQIWYLTALMLIQMAGQKQAGLVLENLKGLKLGISLREASRRMRQRLLNYWSIRTFHRILMAKAGEYGVPVVLVNPKGTSKSCLVCGESLRGQDKGCPFCGLSRHYVAAINIAHKGLTEFPALVGGEVRAGQGVVGAPRCPFSGSTDGGLRCAVTTGSYAVTIRTV